MADANQELLEGQLQTEASREELAAEETATEIDLEQRIAEQAQLEEEQEAENASQLADQQEFYRASQREVSDIPKPSYFIDGVQMSIGFINDAIDALELTGLLAILSLFISFFLSGLNLLIAFLSGNNISHTRAGSKLKQRQIIKLAIGGGLEMIPIVSLIPWSIIFNIWSWANKAKAYKDARREAAEDTASTETPEMV